MAIEDFKGYQSRRLNMPDGGFNICFSLEITRRGWRCRMEIETSFA